MIHYFDSPAHIVRFTAEKCGKAESWVSGSRDHFLGSGPSAINSMLAKGGDESDVPAARRLLARMEASFPETERAYFAPSVAGAYPCVPDAIIGMPEPMRAKAYQPNDGAPIKLGVVTTISAQIGADAYAARSAAMLAILMHLNNTGRAVELYSVSMTHGIKDGETICICRIPSVPLSLAEANMAMGNLAFSRRIPFAIGEALNEFDGRWPVDFSESDNGKAYTAAIAKREGFQMILPPLHANEAKAVMADPAKWMLTKYEAIQAQIEAIA